MDLSQPVLQVPRFEGGEQCCRRTVQGSYGDAQPVLEESITLPRGRKPSWLSGLSRHDSPGNLRSDPRGRDVVDIPNCRTALAPLSSVCDIPSMR